MTRGEIVQDLKAMIGTGCEVDDGQLATWVNDYYMQMVDEIVKVNPDYFLKSSTTATVATQQEYDLPNEWDKIAMINIQIDGVWKRVLPMGDADIRHIPTHSDITSSQGFSTAEPRYYIVGDNIGIMPIPDTTTASAIKVWYTYTPSEMTLDSDVPAFPSKYHHIIKYGAYANYLDQDDEHVAAERMRQRFDAYVTRMIENMTDKQTDEPRSVTITQNPDMYSDDTYI
jgi:hypothetical protein